MGFNGNGMTSSLVLVVGGARSGKSAFAEKIALQFDKVAYLATAIPLDDEMAARIKNHRNSRPDNWKTFEVENSMVDRAKEAFYEAEAVIIDCLTVYTARRMESMRNDIDIVGEIIEVTKTAKSLGKTLILVSNDVGMGLVPEHPVGRRYRDLLGYVNQRVAKIADQVWLMVVGIPVDIKSIGNISVLEGLIKE